MVEIKSAKEKILDVLKKIGKSSTTRIANEVKIDYVYATQLLEELKKEKKIKKREETVATYWELR